MLVLTRKKGEKILIGKDTVVTIVNVGRGLVRVGIETPRDVVVLREELVKKEGTSLYVLPKTN